MHARLALDYHGTRAALALLLLSVTATAQLAETFGTHDFTAPRPPKPALRSLSLQNGFELPDDLPPSFALPPIDERVALEEDAIDASIGATKPVRYGLGRDLLFELADGVWHELGGGRWLWTADIVSRGAVGIRLGISDMDLPEGAELVVFAPQQPEIVAGPYGGRGPHDDGHVWTPTRAGDRVRLEYLVKDIRPGVAPGEPPFRVRRLQHLYRLPQLSGGGGSGAGSCHNDVSCYPAFSNLRNACAGIGTVDQNALYCSGQLLNTVAGDLTPYWMTANHCLSTGTQAADAEIYWFYQTTTCNGAPPSLASVPTSAGCTLMSTGAGSDYTLLIVNGTLPSGLYWAGWTPVAPLNGEPGAGIHHPAGDYKRISFGNHSPQAICSPSGHFQVQWTNGATEPGSSGSGFFKTSTQQFVGQLHCGSSTCSTGTVAGYGRFADTYATGNVASLLAAGQDDPWEDNDTCGGNPDIPVGSYPGLVVKSTDDDWYEILVPAGALLTVNLSFTHANGDIDTRLWVNCSDPTYTASSTGVTNSETLSWANDTGAANTVAWNVYLYDDTRNTYSMSVSLTPPNNACASATEIYDDVTYDGSTYDATNSTAGTCGLSATAPDVWFRYTATATGLLQISTAGSQLDTVVSVYDACGGSEQACNDDAPAGAPAGHGSLASYLDYLVLAGVEYRIRVAGYNGTEGPFQIRVDTDTGAPYCLGDGVSASTCPCSNHSTPSQEAGCRNSTATAGRLLATGTADVSNDSVVLQGSGMPPNSPCLYFQGTAKQGSGLGAFFGDGLRCAAGSVIRLGTKTNSATGTSSYPTGADLSVSDRGQVPQPGGYRYYQLWYRNSASYCTSSTFNLSNGYALAWRP